MQAPQDHSNPSSEHSNDEGNQWVDVQQDPSAADSSYQSFASPSQQPQPIQQQQQENKQPILGCDHYQRKCQVQAPCCKIFYWCKLCHDALYKGPKANWCKTERMEFQNVQKIKCEICQQIQDPSQKCIKCSTVFGKYACLKCKLYQNDPKATNLIFHCDKCGMCRKGQPELFRHCDGCGYCISISNKSHKCFQIGDSECPVCLQVLKYSVQGYIPLNCGHLIHAKCLALYCKTDCNCPICGMAMENMSKLHIERIDDIISKSPELPQQLKGKKVNVICNECLHKTMDAPFHFYGVKCGKCNSYNTKMM